MHVAFSIEENTEPGSIVGYLSSTDLAVDTHADADVSDLDSDGNETYWLVAGNAMDTFIVDSLTGSLVIGGDVDYELCSHYALVVSILDAVGTCVRQLSVDVLVVNLNDNPPQFDLDLTYITIRDATPIGAEVYAPAARDADGSRLSYALMGAGPPSTDAAHWLAVDDVTGHVVVRRALTDAPRRMHAVVVARDDDDDVSGDVIGRATTSMTLVATVVKDARSRGRGLWGRGLAGDWQQQRVAVVECAEVGSVVADMAGVASFCSSTPVYSVVAATDFDTFTVDRFTGE